jgi:hypothetical protein
MARAGNCQEGRTQVTFFQRPLNTVTYRDDILDPIVLCFLQQRNFGHVFQHHNAKCHVAHDCLPNQSLDKGYCSIRAQVRYAAHVVFSLDLGISTNEYCYNI